MCCADKVQDENEIVIRGDMNLTIGQIISSRNGNWASRKWPNGIIPYTFHENIYEKERNVVSKIAKRFNKDLRGCLQIR